jgi:hypothetical protein
LAFGFGSLFKACFGGIDAIVMGGRKISSSLSDPIVTVMDGMMGNDVFTTGLHHPQFCV